MVRIKSPLFSFDASGTLGDAITYSKWRGRAYVKRYVKPVDSKTPNQLAHRFKFKVYANHFKLLDEPTQTHWEQYGEEIVKPPLNAIDVYIQESFRQNIDPGADPYVDPVCPW